MSIWDDDSDEWRELMAEHESPRSEPVPAAFYTCPMCSGCGVIPEPDPWRVPWNARCCRSCNGTGHLVASFAKEPK